jgi:hypothetical protein
MSDVDGKPDLLALGRRIIGMARGGAQILRIDSIHPET